MTTQISTLAELLDTAGTQWRVFDIGRRISKIDRQQFIDIEQTRQPYPYPLAQHAMLAIQFWDPKASREPYVWFLKFPLDEQSKLIAASRDHFASMVFEALGTELTGDDENHGQLDNNPYVFTPNANKLAAFNARLKVELNKPASQYYEYAQLYFSGKLGYDNWQSVGLQGIADFALRIDKADNEQALLGAWNSLPVEVKHPLGAMLEHVKVDTQVAEFLYQDGMSALESGDKDALLCALRAVSDARAQGLVAQLVDAVLSSPLASDSDLLLTIAGRCWMTLAEPERLYRFMERAAEHTEIEVLFTSIFADLVAIPMLRPHVLALLRIEDRSELLARAIGRLFS